MVSVWQEKRLTRLRKSGQTTKVLKQVNFLLEESIHTGIGGSTVVSMLHYYFDYYGVSVTTLSNRQHGRRICACPVHVNCTATLPTNEPLSKYTAGAETGRQFAVQDVGLQYIVTDGDAHSAEGVKAGMSAMT